ncbi:serine/threonine protein kinase, partial [Planctomycetota bacterium]|nr:serine/threonine protein kinase [Planctomycetota bacterium]
LDHPNVVRVLDTGELGPDPFIVMELVEGGTLRHWLRGFADELLETRLLLFDGVCAGVEHAHRRGVIHRDLKPENVLLDDAGRPRVTDFGLAKRTNLDVGVEQEHLTADGAQMGTLAYMSPEQALGHSRRVDVRSDVYALGVMLYELLCGQRPFTGGMATILAEKVGGDMKPPSAVNPEVPWELEAICLRATEVKPERRYATATALRDELGRYRAGLPILARPAGAGYRLRKWVTRHRTHVRWGGALATVLLISLATTAWTMFQSARLRQQVEEARRTDVEAAVRSGWEAAAVGSYALAGERFRGASSLIASSPVRLELAAGMVPERLAADVDVDYAGLVTPSLLREWERAVQRRAGEDEAERRAAEGRQAWDLARVGFQEGSDPVQVRRQYLDALELLRGAVELAPTNARVRATHADMSAEVAAVLVDQGFSELADFIREVGRVDSSIHVGEPPKDLHLNTVEGDKVRVRQAFGSRVFFARTKAFGGLREWLRVAAPNLSCTCVIRTEITAEGLLPTLHLSGIDVRVENRELRTVWPVVNVPLADLNVVRPVTQDSRGFRIVSALDETPGFDAAAVVAQLRNALEHELVKHRPR